MQFYDSDGFLCDRVTAYLSEGARADQALLVVATAPHRDAILAGLRRAGAQPDRLLEEGRLRLLDADETLDRIMSDGLPDPVRFRETIGGAIEAAAREGRTVRVYGELVDLLWRTGRHEGVHRVEELWNALAAERPFRLLCGYAMSNFAAASDGPSFDRICGEHTSVIPAGPSVAGRSEGARRQVARLQQRAAALEQELRHRADLEARLREALAERERVETEREALLRREQTARAEAEAASRLKDEFLAVLSHELRTPLNAILGWTDIASGRQSDAPTVRRALEIIQRNTRLQLRIVDDLLDVSRIVTGQLRVAAEPVSLRAVLTAALDSVRPAAAARRITIVEHPDAAEPEVSGDFGRLQQVVWNLLSNAVKFTPPGGRIETGIRILGDRAEVVVSDTGQGIDPAFLPHVFHRFRQEDSGTARAHGGLGLGLALVRHLVEAHGGTVRAESLGEGKGATFTVTLPLRGSHEIQHAAASERSFGTESTPAAASSPTPAPS